MDLNKNKVKQSQLLQHQYTLSNSDKESETPEQAGASQLIEDRQDKIHHVKHGKKSPLQGENREGINMPKQTYQSSKKKINKKYKLYITIVDKIN